MAEIEVLSDLASELALGAGEVLRKGRSAGHGAISSKSSAVDIVTETDEASEDYIVSALRSRRAGDAILGEEGTADVGTSGVRWILDPLDGTVNFTYGIPAFAVSIAVEVDGVRTVGAVYNPVSEELFTAIRGRGAQLNGVAIHCRSETRPAMALVGTGFSYVARERQTQAEILVDILPTVRDIRRAGSAALDLCAVACGRLDAYYELTVKPWDVAAGALIASEAGAVVTSLTGEQAEFDVIAGNATLQDNLRQRVSSAIQASPSS